MGGCQKIGTILSSTKVMSKLEIYFKSLAVQKVGSESKFRSNQDLASFNLLLYIYICQIYIYFWFIR